MRRLRAWKGLALLSNWFTTSNFNRREFDHYPTVDARCIKSLLDAYPDIPMPSLDPFCNINEPTKLHPAVNGSLRDMKGRYQSVITNPPYKKTLVDDLAKSVIGAVIDGDIQVACLLMRIGWDCAKTRASYWQWPFACSLRLQYRPYWSEEPATASPIHNYQWLIFDRRIPHEKEPVVRYHNGVTDE